MTNSKSRQSKIAEHTVRFERFMYEMDSIEAITEDIHELIEINHDPIIVQQLENRIEYFNFMVAQLKSDTTEWGLKLKKDMRLLEAVVGECDLDYEWIFDGCDIHWLTDRYWQHCPQNTLRATLSGHSAIIENYPLDHQMTVSDLIRAEIYKNKAKVILILSEVEDFEIALREAKNDLGKENLNASQVQTLEDEIAGLQSQLDDKQHRARQWGKDLGKDEELIEAISAEYCEFEWIFEYCDLD